MADLLILAHGGSWERRFQVSSLAASTAASGRAVDLALFFAALDAWVGERWDRLDPEPPLTADGLELAAPPSLEAMLASARSGGTLRLLGCSASMRYLALDSARVQRRVDLIAGWQTFSKLALEASRTVTL